MSIRGNFNDTYILPSPVSTTKSTPMRGDGFANLICCFGFCLYFFFHDQGTWKKLCYLTYSGQ